MKNYWISFWQNWDENGEFEIHSPWWISGSRFGNDEMEESVCCAVKAKSEKEAKKYIINCFDNPPDNLEWRFCEIQDKDWSPFDGRFPRADWMKWE